MSPVDATAERPVYFGPDDDLFGVLTAPTGAARGVGVALMNWGNWDPAGPDRLLVRLARRLADDGFHSLRYNVRGVGESRGRVAGFHGGSPPVDEAAAALDLLRAEGITRLATVGYCLGARAGLAVSAAPDVVAHALLAPVLLDFRPTDRWRALPAAAHLVGLRGDLRRRSIRTPDGRRRALRRLWAAAAAVERHRGRPPSTGRGRHRWVATGLAAPLEDLAARRVPVLFLFGDADAYLDDFRLARLGGLRRPLRRSDRIELRVIAGQVHRIDDPAVGRRVVDATAEWLAASIPAVGDPAPSTSAP